MADRWNHRTVVVDNAKPVRVFLPGDSADAEYPAGFRIRVRGAGGTVVHAYRCPVHGLFDARVDRANVPDEVPCPREGEDSNFPFEYDLDVDDPPYCGLTAPWAGSFAGQGIAAGEVAT